MRGFGPRHPARRRSGVPANPVGAPLAAPSAGQGEPCPYKGGDVSSKQAIGRGAVTLLRLLYN